jgi:hypothetical protein
MFISDIAAVTSWYTNDSRFQIIRGNPAYIRRSEKSDAPISAIYGDLLQEVKPAYMATGNGVGLEVFQFVDPEYVKSEMVFEYNRGEFFHICFTDPDPEELVQKVLKTGGSRQDFTVKLTGGVTYVHIKDPWGDVVEILDASFERLTTMDSATWS